MDNANELRERYSIDPAEEKEYKYKHNPHKTDFSENLQSKKKKIAKRMTVGDRMNESMHKISKGVKKLKELQK